MASVLLKFFRILHLAIHHIGRTSSCWALFIAFFRRKLSEWWRRWSGRPGPSRNTRAAKSSFPGNDAWLCSSASDEPTVSREYLVAASNVPASAGQGSLKLQIGAEGQPTAAP